MKPGHLVPLVILAVGAGIGGAVTFHWLNPPTVDSAASLSVANRTPEQMIGERRPDYTLGSSSGAMTSARDFDGQVVLVNFWATWCAPCREEMPMLSATRDRWQTGGFEVVGIALDDVAQARAFADELGISYPVLIGSTDVMTVPRLYGNQSGVLPYSVLIDRQGIIQWTRLGELEEQELLQRLEPLL